MGFLSSRNWVNVMDLPISITTNGDLISTILYFDIDEGIGNFQLYYNINNEKINIDIKYIDFLVQKDEIKDIVKTKKLKQQFK